MAIDLSKLTPQQIDKFIHMQSIVARQELEWAKVRVLREYYDGVMPVLLTDRQKEFIGKLLTEGEFEFAHNTIKSVIDTLRERLSVSGFTVNGAGIDNEGTEQAPAGETQLAALFWAWWEENRFDAQQIRLHRRALRDGKSYAMVDYDAVNMRPRFTLHQVYDGTTGIVCHRDPENPENILFLNKYFYTFNPLEPGKTGIERKTTYLPGEIRKYIRGVTTGDWQQYSDPEDNNVWPLPWMDKNGVPLGITIHEFENPGGSEVAQIMGLQDGLNKSWLDLIAAADAAGFPLLVTEYEPGGLTPAATDDNDIEGDDEFIVAPGRMMEVEGHMHRIEGANLEQLINVIWTFVAVIGAVSRTPAYYLKPVGGSDVPSGEALKQLDSGLVSRAVERQLIFGQSWADVMVMAYKVERAFGTTSLPELKKMKVQTVWADAEIRNGKMEAETAEIHKRLGVPDEELWGMIGYSPKQIVKFKNVRRTDEAAKVASISGALRSNQASPVLRPPTQAQGQPSATTDASPENIASTEGLNGIQIRAAVELLDKVSAGTIAPQIALELLVSLGIDRGKAETMVNQAKTFKPQAATVVPTGINGNGVQPG